MTLKLDWVPIFTSKPCRVFTLYNGHTYFGCVVHKNNEDIWKAIPFKIGEKSEVIFRGSYSQATRELENWVRQNFM